MLVVSPSTFDHIYAFKSGLYKHIYDENWISLVLSISIVSVCVLIFLILYT